MNTTLKAFEDINWQCPKSITINQYEISVCNFNGIGRKPNYFRIKELFLPEFNLSINEVPYSGKKYSIILNSSSRYSDNEHTHTFGINWQKPVLLNTLILTLESETNELTELFELIYTYTKSQHMENTIVKLFDMVKQNS